MEIAWSGLTILTLLVLIIGWWLGHKSGYAARSRHVEWELAPSFAREDWQNTPTFFDRIEHQSRLLLTNNNAPHEEADAKAVFHRLSIRSEPVIDRYLETAP